uniref:Uncharacterized protein n=1 Tax=Anguilla anguilla TaxID=7936 RepID=A0A0E9RTY6_ANGAN
MFMFKNKKQANLFWRCSNILNLYLH